MQLPHQRTATHSTAAGPRHCQDARSGNRCRPARVLQQLDVWYVQPEFKAASAFRWRKMLSPGHCVMLCGDCGPPAPPNCVACSTGCQCGNASTTGSNSSLSRHDALAARSTYERRSKRFATWHDKTEYAWHVSVETTVFTNYNSVVVVVTSSLMMT